MEVQKKYIYDLITRITHAGIGISAFALFITAKLAQYFFESGQLSHLYWQIHIYFGYALFIFLTMRFVWFFKGSKYSRISNFINIAEWKKIIRTRTIKWEWGHHPLAAVAYLMVYLALSLLIYSGLFLARIQFDQGPIEERFYDDLENLKFYLTDHNVLAWFIFIFTFIHLSALLLHRLKDKVPIFSSMLTGYQYKKKSKGENKNEKK
jgi:cytochrome b